MRKIVFLASFLYFSIGKCADNDLACSNVDLRSEKKQIVTKEGKEFFREPRHQDSVNHCFAVAAADLLTYKFNVPVSSFHLAMKYHELELPTDSHSFAGEGGGDLNELLIQAQTFKICRESAVPSHANYFGQQNDSISQFLSEFNNLHSKIRFNMTFRKGDFYNAYCAFYSCLDTPSEILENHYTLPSKYEQIPACQNYFSGTFNLLESLSKVIRENSEKIVLDSEKKEFKTLPKVIDQMCAKNNGFLSFKYSFKEYFVGWAARNKREEKSKMLVELDKQLSLKNMPAIVYNYGKVNPQGSQHASTVVARKMQNNNCLYLVRDSYGPGCSRYNRAISGCEESEGAFWVTRDLLLEMTKGVYYVE